jgi:hypothetical protein
VIAPSSVPLIGEHIMTTETATFLLRFLVDRVHLDLGW